MLHLFDQNVNIIFFGQLKMCDYVNYLAKALLLEKLSVGNNICSNLPNKCSTVPGFVRRDCLINCLNF